MKPLTALEWHVIHALLLSVNYPPDGIDLKHLRDTAAENARLAERREAHNAQS